METHNGCYYAKRNLNEVNIRRITKTCSGIKGVVVTLGFSVIKTNSEHHHDDIERGDTTGRHDSDKEQ